MLEMSTLALSKRALQVPSIYDLSPPHGAITGDDHGGYVVIAGWVMMCFFTLAVIVRILTRFMPVRVYGTDDIVIGLATVRGQNCDDLCIHWEADSTA
jgi:hypothetical protein